MRSFALISSLALLIYLGLSTSCNITMSKEERNENIMQAPSINQSVSAAVEEPFFTYSTWPDRKWWEKYESKELNYLIELALDQNPTIQTVRSKIDFAYNESVISRAKLFPFVYFNMQDDWDYLSKNGLLRKLNPSIPLNKHFIDFGLSYNYEFDFWHKYRNLYKAAIGETQAAIAETAQAELITATSLAQSFFGLKINMVRQQLYRKLFEVRAYYFELQKQMMDNSLYSILEPLLSEEAVFQAEQQLYNIEQEIEVGKHIVNVLAGRGPDHPLDLDEPIAKLPPKLAVPTNISFELLSRRPDLMAQIWRVDALALRVGAAKADFWPNIDLTGFIGFRTTQWSSLFNMASKTIGLNPNLTLPVYTSGAIAANVGAKKALFDEAVFQYNSLILSSFQQVSDLLAMGRAVFNEQELQSKILSNASDRYNVTVARQKAGLDNALTVYKYLEELIQKELEETALLFQQYVISVNLTKALGGGYLSKGGPSE